MIEEVEINLSRRVTEHGKIVCCAMGWEPLSYLCNFGVVVGIIDKGLTYAR